MVCAIIMSQWYFGHVSLMYIKSLKGDWFYRMLFPVLILAGSLSTAGIVWSIQDCMLGLLIIPNVLALFKLSPVVMRLTREFFRENHR
ncbi:alanine:cation symporter family protein [Enterocloster bolteae]|nr:alanine:cation symporter family protein [Enterocloster bolteae]